MSIAALMINLDDLPSYTQEDDQLSDGVNDAMLTMESAGHELDVLDHALSNMLAIEATLEHDGDLGTQATKYLGLALDATLGRAQTLYVGGMVFDTRSSTCTLEDATADGEKKGIWKTIWAFIVRQYEAAKRFFVNAYKWIIGLFKGSDKKDAEVDKVVEEMVEEVKAPTKKPESASISTPPPASMRTVREPKQEVTEKTESPAATITEVLGDDTITMPPNISLILGGKKSSPGLITIIVKAKVAETTKRLASIENHIAIMAATVAKPFTADIAADTEAITTSFIGIGPQRIDDTIVLGDSIPVRTDLIETTLGRLLVESGLKSRGINIIDVHTSMVKSEDKGELIVFMADVYTKAKELREASASMRTMAKKAAALAKGKAWNTLAYLKTPKEGEMPSNATPEEKKRIELNLKLRAAIVTSPSLRYPMEIVKEANSIADAINEMVTLASKQYKRT